MHVLHVITTLTTGGAEMMLFKVLAHIDPDRFNSTVICLGGETGLSERIRALGVTVYTLDLGGAASVLSGLRRLYQVVRSFRPDVIQGWMYHGNIAASLAGFATGVPVLWNVRQTLYAIENEKPMTRLLIRAGTLGMLKPNRILYNAHQSAAQHQAFGYPAGHTCVIPNGFDTETFRPDASAREALREELGVAEGTFLIGMMARFHPMKDHDTFLRAAASVVQQRDDVGFVLAGREIDGRNLDLVNAIRAHGLQDYVHVLGERSDVPRITAALDVATLSSAWGEGFPNAIGEAMSCEIPCVVTDVGDMPLIVRETGTVVASRDPDALAAAWLHLLDFAPADRRKMGRAARQRVLDQYSIQAVARRYESMYYDYHSLCAA